MTKQYLFAGNRNMKLSLAYLLKESFYGFLNKYLCSFIQVFPGTKKLFDYESKNHLQIFSLK